MPSRIEDYALIGDTRSSALVARDGSIDWWCAPRLDSPACFAALLGTPDHGRWSIRPAGEVIATRRRYLPDTLVLETELDTAEGTVALLDFMLPTADNPVIFRTVQARRGDVPMRMELVVRFDYGSVVPWVRRTGDGLTLVAGPDGLRFHSPVHLVGEDARTTAEFTVLEHRQHSFSLAHYSSMSPPPAPLDARAARRSTESWWGAWVDQCRYDGPWRDEVVRSLITLKALTYAPTGAVVAAATTSLPEDVGGERNWDYRYSWVRDASFTLRAMLVAGYGNEAVAWNAWLRRAVAGCPGDFQIMYDVFGRRRLTEVEIDWLPGYEGSRPVRIGNAASRQFQLDVFGELLDTIHASIKYEVNDPCEPDRDIVIAAMERLDEVWSLPDSGIWESRGPERHYTHSKVMAWVAYDRAILTAEPLDIPDELVARWAATRERIHAEVCERGWSEQKQSFVQYYGGTELDASALVLARVGFLPPDDPRVVATVDAVRRELVVDGLVKRYLTDEERRARAAAGDGSTGPAHTVDGLSGREGTFLMGTFWLAENLSLIGRQDEARELFGRLLALRNDVGLLAEEYDPHAERMVGNFPQAFSHLGLVLTAARLSEAGRHEERADLPHIPPARTRPSRGGEAVGKPAPGPGTTRHPVGTTG